MEVGSPLPELGPTTVHCPISENPDLVMARTTILSYFSSFLFFFHLLQCWVESGVLYTLGKSSNELRSTPTTIPFNISSEMRSCYNVRQVRISNLLSPAAGFRCAPPNLVLPKWLLYTHVFSIYSILYMFL